MNELESLIQKDWVELPTLMSNFDNKIEEAIAEKLRTTQKVFAQYAGWNFCGYVWWGMEEQTFFCEIWVFGEPVEIIRGTLQEIMDEASNKYGSD